MVSEENLEFLIKSAQHKIELVFIAACDSQKIGNVFQKHGVEHIICVKDKRYVLDEVAIKFTKTFYDAIFSGVLVCDAFNSALSATTFNCGGKKHETSLF